ncbi:MAG: helix-turn-helix transcriptional regulator [Porphyromonadaceae bacterium]|nr:helix-turn-helix transcriptional regulator [Porphyromonadaceae bacterium]
MASNGIAEYVKSMRKMYRLTQVDLAWRSGVGLRFVRELEQGKTTVRLDTVNKVLNLFGSQVGVVPAPRPEVDDDAGAEK